MSHLVADIVAGRVHLEQLGPLLLINACQNWHDRQRPHVCMLQGSTELRQHAPAFAVANGMRDAQKWLEPR